MVKEWGAGVQPTETPTATSTPHPLQANSHEAFHVMEPRTASGGKVEMNVALFRSGAASYGGGLVGAVVVQNDVHIQVGRELLSPLG
jgi:hypothetical protein